MKKIMRLRLVRIKGAAGCLVNFCVQTAKLTEITEAEGTANDVKRVSLLFNLKDSNWCASSLTYSKYVFAVDPFVYRNIMY